MRLSAIIFALAVSLLAPAYLAAEVVDSASNGFTVRTTLSIQASPADVYQRLVRNVGDWWNSAHTFSGDAHNMSIDDKPGGCFCEKLPGGGGVQHFEVSVASPGKTLLFRGAMGPMLSKALMGGLEITLVPAEGGTKLTVSLNAGGYLPGGVNAMAGVADVVVAEQFTR
ncbi:MAG TPA: hypothetical protein VNH18_36230, partial [Bryobacteraceae bacterium]|nr:hypothetical protein [Bryobacteraceae bacterium]